jgi:hypothetical protein
VTLEETVLVVTVNVALVEFAGTVTEAGTCAAALLLESVTTAPPTGAMALSVTVPVEFALPPTTLVGFIDSPDTVLGVIVRLAVRLLLLYAAVIVAVVLDDTVVVVTVNVAVVAFAATVTLAGTCAAALLLESVTTVPPAGATELKVTVPVDVALPPTTLVGFSVNPVTVLGVTVRVALALFPL